VVAQRDGALGDTVAGAHREMGEFLEEHVQLAEARADNAHGDLVP
jgi:hypothetical protein